MTKAERIDSIRKQISALTDACEAERDAIPDTLTDEEYDTADKAIFDRYQAKRERLYIEMEAARCVTPRNDWFCGVMAEYTAKAVSGYHEEKISPRQYQVFARYTTELERGERGADINGHLVKLIPYRFGWLIQIKKY